MSRWIVALALWPLLGSEASALSCMPPTPESVFARHQNSPGDYVMAVGKISLIDPFPKFNPQTLRHEPSDRFRATFDGQLARASGFDLSVSLPVMVQMNCFDEVCGFLPLRRPAAMFIQKAEDGYLVRTDYCSSTMLADPSDTDLARLLQCFNGAACAAPD